MIHVSVPNPVYVAKGALKTPVRFLGLMSYQKPLQNSSESFPEQPASDWYGQPTLTSLALKLDGMVITLIDCVMTVTQEKNIITTALQGRDGTIKEYISDDDYRIELRASVQPPPDENGFAPPDIYPIDELKELLEMFRASESIEVQNDFITLFGIDSVVLQSYSFEQETDRNRQYFHATLLSDSAYEIKLRVEKG